MPFRAFEKDVKNKIKYLGKLMDLKLKKSGRLRRLKKNQEESSTYLA